MNPAAAHDARLRPRRRLRITDGSGSAALLALPILFLVVMLVVPLVLLGVSTFTNGFQAVSDVWSDDAFVSSLQTTAIIAGAVTAMTLVVGTLYALGLALAPGWLRAMLLASLLGILASSLLVRSYGWILIYLPTGVLYKVGGWLGLVDEPLSIYQTTTAMYPAMVHVMLPFMILPIFAALRRFDHQQLRAAQTLGARPLLVLRRVVLPQLRASMLAGSVLVFLISLGFFITPQLLGDPSDTTVAMLIARRFDQAEYYEQAATMSLFLVVIVFVFYVVADRVFRISEQWSAAR